MTEYDSERLADMALENAYREVKQSFKTQSQKIRDLHKMLEYDKKQVNDETTTKPKRNG